MNTEYVKKLYKNLEYIKMNHLTEFLLAEQLKFKKSYGINDRVS